MNRHLRSVLAGPAPRRKRLLVVTSWLTLAAAVLFALSLNSPVRTAEASHGRIAMLAGTSGLVTSAQCYGPTIWQPCGNPHASTNPYPFDIGAGGTSPVYAQVDYLPSNISGGFIRADTVSTGCAATDGPYSGYRVRVEVQYFDLSGNFVNWNHESYVHMSSAFAGIVNNGWFNWNNPSATVPLWPPALEDYRLNNTTAGGAHLGSVHTWVSGGDTNCSDGSHLHMEADSDGNYNFARTYLESVTGRFSDIHFVHLAGINGLHP